MTVFKKILASISMLIATNVMASSDTVVHEFTAFGSQGVQNNWRAVVKKGRMSLEIAKDEYHPKIRTERLAYAKGVELTGKAKAGDVVTLNIRGQTCTDGQGKQHEFTATLYYKNQVIKGCAVRGINHRAPI